MPLKPLCHNGLRGAIFVNNFISAKTTRQILHTITLGRVPVAHNRIYLLLGVKLDGATRTVFLSAPPRRLLLFDGQSTVDALEIRAATILQILVSEVTKILYM